jgi:hypothetical protein
MKHLAVVALVVATVACGNKDKSKDTSGSAAGSSMAGSSMAGSGSGWTGSDTGSGMAGSGMSGSGMAGSGAGSGSAAMAGSGDASAGSDSFNWEAMTHQQRMDYMKKTVVPTMKPLFLKFDAKHYANFGCKTCHGKDPKAAKFKMPTADLPKLDFAALKAGKQKPTIAKFMGEVVKPQMATLLHQPEYTETNPKGFGCLECHMQKK